MGAWRRPGSDGKPRCRGLKKRPWPLSSGRRRENKLRERGNGLSYSAVAIRGWAIVDLYPVDPQWAERQPHATSAKYREMYERSVKDPDGFWAEMAERLDWSRSRPGSRTPRSRATSRSAGSRTASSTSATTASTAIWPQRGRSDRDHLGRRRPGGRAARSPTASCTTKVCRLANVLKAHGRQEGRPGHHLPADDPRGGLRDAGLRPHRRRPLGGVRRLLAGQPAPTASTTPSCQAGHHRRRGPARRPGGAAEGERRQGAGEVPRVDVKVADVPPHRHGRADDARAATSMPAS